MVQHGAHGGTAAAGGGEVGGLELRAHRIVKIHARDLRRGIERRKDRHDDADALEHEAEIVAQQLRESAHFSLQAHLGELRAAEKVEAVFEHARHFPRGCRDASDGHERVAIDLQHLVRTVIHDHVTRGGAAVAGNEHAVGEFEREDRGRVRLRDW